MPRRKRPPMQLQQEPHHILVPAERRSVQRRPLLDVFGVHVAAQADEAAHGRQEPGGGREEEWSDVFLVAFFQKGALTQEEFGNLV